MARLLARAATDPTMRAIAFLLSQFTEPHLMDDQDTRDLLDESHTPMDATLRAILNELQHTP